MSVPKRLQHLSVAEYLEAERDSPVRHEYIDGQIYAMAGSSDRHNRVAGNFYNRLDDHLGGRGDRWSSQVLTDLNEELQLESVGLTLTVAQIYRRVMMPQRARRR